MDAVKEHDIIFGFRRGLDHHKLFGRGSTASELHTFYTQFSFLFNEGVLSAERHTSILTFYLHAFVWPSSFKGQYVSSQFTIVRSSNKY